MRVKIKQLHPDALIPQYQTLGAAGFDLHALEDYKLSAGERALVKTGLAFELQIGFELQIRPRSGLALKNGISVLNAPGTIDSDYRGEVGVLLINHSKEDFAIKKGDRIAQGVVARYERVEFEVCEELGESARGAGGFGSSGV